MMMDGTHVCIVCRVNEKCGLQGLPRLRMVIARRTPSTVQGICERGLLGRAAAHHRSGELHDGRWLHLRGMDRGRCQRNLFNVVVVVVVVS